MTEAITLDEIDTTAASAFEGYVVRKDLAQQFKGAYPVPTYVGEFLIGRYCATTDPEEIEEGLQVTEIEWAKGQSPAETLPIQAPPETAEAPAAPPRARARKKATKTATAEA